MAWGTSTKHLERFNVHDVGPPSYRIVQLSRR